MRSRSGSRSRQATEGTWLHRHFALDPKALGPTPTHAARILGIENRLRAEAQAVSARLGKIEERLDRMAVALRGLLAEHASDSEE